MLPVSLDCQFLIAPTVFFVVEFVLFVLVLCLLFPMLPVSLDCQFLIAPTVFFVVKFVLFVLVLCLVSHVASVSRLSILDCPYSFLCCEICFVCPCLMSFVSHVASVSRLSILDCPYSFLCWGILFCLSSSDVFCFPCCQCL
jgi:hypothetical protein